MDQVVEDVPGLAAVQGPTGLAVMLLDQIVDGRRVIFQPDRVANPAEDPTVFDHRGVGNLHLEENPAEEGLVDQLLGLEVGGEDQNLGEGDHHGGTGPTDVEVVVAGLQGNDEPVEQVLRAQLLAAEVVHQEKSAVGLQLQRSLEEAQPGIKAQLQLPTCQLASGPDHRPGAESPAGVMGRQIGGDRTVVHRVKYPNHLTFDVEGVRYEDGVPEQGSTGLGDAALTVSRRSIEKDRLAGAQRRPQAIEHAGWQHQMIQGGPQHLMGHRIAAPALVPGDRDIDIQGHRGGACVLIDLHHFLGPLPTAPVDGVLPAIGELRAADGAADPGGRDVALVRQELECVTHDGPGQAHMARDLPTEHGPVVVDDLEDQIVDEACRDAGLLGSLGNGWESDLGPLGSGDGHGG